MSQPARRRWLSTIALTPVALSVLAACSSTRIIRPDLSEVDTLVATGYPGTTQATIERTSIDWQLGDTQLLIETVMPNTGTSLPVVVYLPGLGESAEAGQGWRDAWARGGYAVLSLQPLTADASAWSSPQARAGEFQALGRERFSANRAQIRLLALSKALLEVMSRSDRREAPWSRLDLDRLAIAGFELGGQATMVSVGETLPADPLMPGQSASERLPVNGSASSKGSVLPIAPRAAIVLSPFVPPSVATPSASPYTSIRVPVLSVTTRQDFDPLSLVRSPVTRRRPYELMPAGEKYLLTLNDANHETLSGPTLEQLTRSEPDTRRDDNSATSSAQSGRRRGDRRGDRGSIADGPSAGGPGRPTTLLGVSISPTAQALAITLVQAVSVAFLDATLKGDPRARAWLTQEAPRWLAARGELLTR